MPSKKLVIVVVFAILMLGCAAEEKPPAELTPEIPAEMVEIPIGVLVDLSGALKTYGEDIKTCIEIASTEINSYFEAENKPYKVRLYIEDTKVDPKIALDKVQILHGKGVRIIIGPMGSGEVKNIASYVTDNKIVIVSPSSTAAPKYIGVTTPEEKKYIFRFVATDAFQTKAIAKLASDLGIKAVVITYIGNAWGKGLDEFGSTEFENANISVASHVEYPDPAPAEFTPFIATLEDEIKKLLTNYTADEVAVVAFSYEEVATMLSQVSDDSVLLTVKWIGCDGTAKSSKVVEDVPEKASKVGIYSTVAEIRGEAYEKLNDTYFKQVGGSPKSYGMNSYDAAWVVALSFAESYDELGTYDPDDLVAKIPEISEKYSKGEYGVKTVSGPIKLDEYNDRIVTEYKIYKVEEGSWVEAGTWYYENATIQWL